MLPGHSTKVPSSSGSYSTRNKEPGGCEKPESVIRAGTSKNGAAVEFTNALVELNRIVSFTTLELSSNENKAVYVVRLSPSTKVVFVNVALPVESVASHPATLSMNVLLKMFSPLSSISIALLVPASRDTLLSLKKLLLLPVRR